MIFSIATTGSQDMRLPQWGRAFWQDPNDDEIFLAYGSGTSEVDFITSTNGGLSWSAPELLFPVEDFHIHNNFDTVMDRSGHIHCGFRFNGSGCYQFVGKLPGGGWTRASGIGPIGLVAAGDSGNLAKGFQGSLTMQEHPFASEVAGISFPAVKMIVKDSANDMTTAVLGTPYNVAPSLDPLQFGDIAAGASGGFPIIYVSEIFGLKTSYATYYDAEDNELKTWHRDFGGWFGTPDERAIESDEVRFGPSMAIGSGLNGSHGMAVVCSSGIGGVGQSIYHWTEDTDEYINVKDIANGTENSWVTKAGSLNGSTSGLLIQSGIVPTGDMYGIGPNNFSGEGVTRHNFPGEGTNCDFSFNDDGEFLFYFQKKNEWGKQSIGRFKADFDGSNWVFPTMDDQDKGLKHPASVGQSQTGGWSNTLFWGGFKALKHPTEPAGASGTKQELLVTQGHVSTYPSGGILTVWDVEQSPALGRWQESEFTIDYTLTSGTANEIFTGIAAYTNVQFTSHYEESPNLFDDDNTTYGRVRDGYTLTLELDKIRTIERVEVLQRNGTTSAPGIAVSGTLDGINHVRLFTIPSGAISSLPPQNSSLEKYMAGTQTVTESLNVASLVPIFNINPFTAKFVTLQFFNSIQSSSRVYEIKLFGPAATNPEVVTWSNSTSDPPPYNRQIVRSPLQTTQQTFRQEQGTLPEGWRTSGDFEWGIVASGNATRTNFLPSTPLPVDFDGTVQSGIWSFVFPQRGTDDGFSIRSEAIGDASGLGSPLRIVPSGGIQPGHSAILEVDIDVNIDERLPDGSAGREFGFYIRSDVHVDDKIEFFIDNVLQETYGDMHWHTLDAFNSNIPELGERETFSTSLAGAQTLKWVYTKGVYDIPADRLLYPYGAAWIDGVFGLDPVDIEFGPRHQRYGYLTGGSPFEISSINGYVISSGIATEFIHGYIPSGLPQQSFRDGYLVGLGTEASGLIHGFLHGHELTTSQVHSYLFGNVPVDPTGVSSVIDGFLIGGFGSGDMSSQDNIHGYLEGLTGAQLIHGYIAGESGEFTSKFRHGFTQGWDGGIFGLGPNQKAIYGYVLPPIGSGSISVHGYLLGNYPNSSIYGYLGSEGLVPSGGGLVGNPSTSNVVPGVNFLHGYLKGEISAQAIHGYVKRPPIATSTIKGYVLSGAADMTIHGFVDASDEIPSSIHGYASGLGFNSSSIHGYVFGVSGIITTSIHGYLTGVGLPSSEIWGTLIGSIVAESSSSACPSHNFPLCPLLSITLPSGFIN